MRNRPATLACGFDPENSGAGRSRSRNLKRNLVVGNTRYRNGAVVHYEGCVVEIHTPRYAAYRQQRLHSSANPR